MSFSSAEKLMRTIDAKTKTICTEIDPADFLLTNALRRRSSPARREAGMWIKERTRLIWVIRAVTTVECSRYMGRRGERTIRSGE